MRRLISARRFGAALACAALLVATAATPASAAPKNTAANPTKLAGTLVKQATGAGANRHLIAFQRIADQNGGTRADQTPGYEASVEYVAGKLRQAGFRVTTPAFTYEAEVIDAATLTVGSSAYTPDQMTFSLNTPVDGLTAPLVVAPADGTPGCEATDYAGLPVVGSVVLVARGVCPFAQKGQIAANAGAVAVIIANNAPGPLSGTLGAEGAVAVPVAGITQEAGTALAAQAGQPVTLDVRTSFVERTSRSVIAQTRTGRIDNVVMAGAHLDSVPGGAGINDNGSGSAALLELATQLGGSPKVTNAVRFAWWGAEELGLIGSTEYVAGLSFEQQLDIALYLNFDMVASPNPAYFVYDGDDSEAEGAGAGPFGSAQIEKTFVDFFDSEVGVPTEGTDFSGRSDYGAFIANGIPAGGLFTGAEGIKTPQQAAKWGGTAGVAYDPCYHAACDNLGNLDRVALDRNLDAIAWSVGIYATSTEAVNGVPGKAARAKARAASKVAVADGTTLDDKAA